MIKKLLWLGLAVAETVCASPVTYNIDPTHTYPSFEADHMGGQSLWRGKFNRTTGAVVLDADAKTGTVDVTVDTSSINFGLDAMDANAKSAELFDVARYPTATYRGEISKWVDNKPVEVDGIFTLKGISRPLKLTINSFLCKPNPLIKKEVCGADASASFNRDEWGLDYGKAFGFKMETKLLISIEAVKRD